MNAAELKGGRLEPGGLGGRLELGGIGGRYNTVSNAGWSLGVQAHTSGSHETLKRELLGGIGKLIHGCISSGASRGSHNKRTRVDQVYLGEDGEEEFGQ